MAVGIKGYVVSCYTCRRAISHHQRPAGLLPPIPTLLQPPLHPWHTVSLDFITDLPPSPWLCIHTTHLGSFYQDGLFHTAVNLGGILFQLLNIFSPSPTMNAEAEKTNQVLQQYLRCYCTYSQDNWPSLISLAEFSYDNFLHTSIDSLSSFLIQGFHQRTQGNRSWGLFARATGFPDPLETAAWTGETVTREDCGPPIPEGDKVMLSTKFLVSTRPLRR